MSDKKDKENKGPKDQECASCHGMFAAADVKTDGKTIICLNEYYKKYDTCMECKKIVLKEDIREDKIDMMDVNTRCKECHYKLHVACTKCHQDGDKDIMKDGMCPDCRGEGEPVMMPE